MIALLLYINYFYYLRKAESAMLVQLRKGHIELRHFLNKVQVLEYGLEQCSCGTGPETLRNVLIRRPYKAERCAVLGKVLRCQLCLGRLLDTLRGVPAASSG